MRGHRLGDVGADSAMGNHQVLGNAECGFLQFIAIGVDPAHVDCAGAGIVGNACAQQAAGTAFRRGQGLRLCRQMGNQPFDRRECFRAQHAHTPLLWRLPGTRCLHRAR